MKKEPAAKTPQTDPKDQEIEKLKQELTEMTEISKRALADLQNFKRRSEDEKQAFVAYANVALISELLPSIENIYRVMEHENKDTEWAKGVEQTLKQVLQSLEKIGLKVIPTKDRMFDPNLHEAMMVAPGEKDKILSELEKGYMLNGKVVKPAKVSVGNGEDA